MTELLTSAQMRAIEAAAIASGAVTGLELMERAGAGVVQAVLEEWPEFAEGSHRAVVLCGPGGNGGDGFVVARLLKARGWEVEVFLYGEPARMPPDARVSYERWLGMGEVVGVGPETGRLFWTHHDEGRPDVWVDAIFGTGLSRPVPAILGHLLFEAAASANALVYSPRGKFVAVDIPTGIQSDSGEVMMAEGEPEEAREYDVRTGKSRTVLDSRLPHFPWHCDLTVTFHRAKIGHLAGEGIRFCGKLVTKDIGLMGFTGDRP